MTNRIIEEFWLEADTPDLGVGQAMPAGPPTTQPGGPGDPMGANSPQIPPQGGQPPPQPDDLSNDPEYPEMPDTEEDQDFENWKIAYVKESIKGDPNTLEEMILKVRDKVADMPNAAKFCWDNLQICFLRQHQDILIPSHKIRKLVKQQLDRNAPGRTLIEHITTVLNENPLVNNIYIKLLGTGGGKLDYHRKFIGALLGAVQVGSGANNEDLVFEEMDYSLRISTRYNSKWGDVNLGGWTLKENDPDKYLKAPELKRLEGGSPEEKDVLRRRVVIESIAEMFKERCFIINVVGSDGTIMHVGLDLGNCLRAAYIDGKLVVRTRDSDILQAFIDEQGSIVPIPDMSIFYVKEGGGELGENGEKDMEEIEFIAHEDGHLYLRAQADLIKEASTSLQGIIYKETPWTGNPSDFLRISRCTPNCSEILLRQC